jgi:hypothetical protein
VLKAKTKMATQNTTLNGTFLFSMGDICLHIVAKRLSPEHQSLYISREYSILGFHFHFFHLDLKEIEEIDGGACIDEASLSS